MDRLADVIVYPAAFLDGADDGGKVIVGKHHIGNVFGDIGAGYAHTDADICAFYGRCVVYAVAGHCGDIACLAPRRNNARFMLGLNARIDAYILKFALKLLIAHL